jgi:hypothetical protein
MLGWLEWRWLRGIYRPQPPKQPLGWLLSMGVPDSPVRQPRHPTVRVRAVLTVGALSSSGTGQVLFTVWCASGGCSDFCAHCLRTVAFAGVRCSRPLHWKPLLRLVHRTVQWHTGQSGAPDQGTLRFFCSFAFEP